MKTILAKAHCLRDLAEKFNLHGLYFQHMALCRRRAWLHLQGATHAIRNDRVQRGTALHQRDRGEDATPLGLGIVPDGIDFARRAVIERKGSAGARDAVSRQALFYAAFMTAATGELWHAEVQVYGTRKPIIYDLSESVLDQLIADARSSHELREGAAPLAYRIPICPSCSCNLLCWEDE